MRLLNTLAIVILFTTASVAQISKEYEYTSSGNYVELANSGDKYYTLNWLANRCEIYNTDHSLWKTINLQVPSGQYLYDIRHVSETLFNLDGKVELAYTYYAYDTALYYYTYTTKIINEDGTLLTSLAGCSYSEIHTLTTGAAKMLAWVYDYSLIPYTVHTVVLAIPGTPVSNKIPVESTEIQLRPAFPNPCTNAVTLPYRLPEQTIEGTMEVIDFKGTAVRTFRLGTEYSELLVNTDGWPRGAYHYRVIAGGMALPGGTFIVR